MILQVISKLGKNKFVRMHIGGHGPLLCSLLQIKSWNATLVREVTDVENVQGVVKCEEMESKNTAFGV